MWIGYKYSSFSHLLKRVNFDAVVDHLALTHTMKSKSEPATTVNKRLLEVFCSYTFSLYSLKVKGCLLISNMEGDKSDPYDVIPILFNSHSILTVYYCTFFILQSERYRIVSRSQIKAGVTQMQKCMEQIK